MYDIYELLKPAYKLEKKINQENQIGGLVINGNKV